MKASLGYNSLNKLNKLKLFPVPILLIYNFKSFMVNASSKSEGFFRLLSSNITSLQLLEVLWRLPNLKASLDNYIPMRMVCEIAYDNLIWYSF